MIFETAIGNLSCSEGYFQFLDCIIVGRSYISWNKLSVGGRGVPRQIYSCLIVF